MTIDHRVLLCTWSNSAYNVLVNRTLCGHCWNKQGESIVDLVFRLAQGPALVINRKTLRTHTHTHTDIHTK